MYKRTEDQIKKRIAIVGGGASGLFLFKRLLESGNSLLEVTIFEKKQQIGSGMPYSGLGANEEHITNVSENEIPLLVTSVEQWIKTVPKQVLERFHIDPDHFNEFKVLPRLLFGEYLCAQFQLLLTAAEKAGLQTKVYYGAKVIDVIDQQDHREVWVELEGKEVFKFDKVIICTGHTWPVKHEGVIPGYFDAPYPPAKLKIKLNHPIAIKGSSLTAIDAIRTLSRHNGTFVKNKEGQLSFLPFKDSPDFKLMMHSRSGMLPAVRFHLEDARLKNNSLLSPEQLAAHIQNNNGFLSLDFIFERDFKEIFQQKDPDFYQHIKDMTIEEFVADMMELRERIAPFELLKAEYAEAALSIKRRESIYWKEMLGVLSFAMNYHAKYLSAEDMQRLQEVLMPLISIVIAYVPQSSCEELIALHDAGILDMVLVSDDSKIEPKPDGGIIYHYTDRHHQNQSIHYQTFINCVGQPHLSYAEFPFKTMRTKQTISPASIKFNSTEQGKRALANGEDKVTQGIDGEFYLEVAGITINDYFQVVDPYGAYNDRIFIMAVPYIGGFNPDYSGLDFCEEASARIVKSILENK